MLEKFYPDYYRQSAYDIPYEMLYQKGFRGIIFDIDNTLVPHGADADDRAITLCNHIKEIGFSICFISNNNEERVKRFNKEIGAPYVYKANKPSRKNYNKAVELLNTTKEQTLFIGDQVFTDVFGANRAQITSILVKPMDKREEIQIVLKRKLEAIVLYFYKKSKREKKIMHGG